MTDTNPTTAGSGVPEEAVSTPVWSLRSIVDSQGDRFDKDSILGMIAKMIPSAERDHPIRSVELGFDQWREMTFAGMPMMVLQPREFADWANKFTWDRRDTSYSLVITTTRWILSIHPDGEEYEMMLDVHWLDASQPNVRYIDGVFQLLNGHRIDPSCLNDDELMALGYSGGDYYDDDEEDDYYDEEEEED